MTASRRLLFGSAMFESGPGGTARDPLAVRAAWEQAAWIEARLVEAGFSDVTVRVRWLGASTWSCDLIGPEERVAIAAKLLAPGERTPPSK